MATLNASVKAIRLQRSQSRLQGNDSKLSRLQCNQSQSIFSKRILNDIIFPF